MSTKGATLAQVFTAEQYEARAGRGITAMRKVCGMTQAQLADALGVSRPRITELEHGRNAFRLRTLHGLAEAFKMDPADLLVELTR